MLSLSLSLSVSLGQSSLRNAGHNFEEHENAEAEVATKKDARQHDEMEWGITRAEDDESQQKKSASRQKESVSREMEEDAFFMPELVHFSGCGSDSRADYYR